MSKVKVETLCPKCRKPLPTRHVVDARLSGKRGYAVIDERDLVLIQGRWRHKECK